MCVLVSNSSFVFSGQVSKESDEEVGEGETNSREQNGKDCRQQGEDEEEER